MDSFDGMPKSSINWDALGYEVLYMDPCLGFCFQDFLNVKILLRTPSYLEIGLTRCFTPQFVQVNQ